MKNQHLFVFSLIIGFFISTFQVSANQPIGYITNVDGNKCWYHQTTKQESYFHSSPANTGYLIFDEPTCMKAVGYEYDVNVMMINNIIARPYSHADAAFQTRINELKNSSFLQNRGKCIQSATYSGIGVVVDYIVSSGFIRSVKHATAVQGCN